jgi:DNA (cytosine-5)-methyltransferase 1
MNRVSTQMNAPSASKTVQSVLPFPVRGVPRREVAPEHTAGGPSALELCAGAGGQAIGLESAGFEHVGLVENDAAACNTLRQNRPSWRVLEHDLFEPLDLTEFKGIDLLAGGLPCPPFSVAGKQLGEKDERNLFNVGVEYVDAIRPRAVMFENVKGMLSPLFAEYRTRIDERLRKLGYVNDWKLLNASDFGVPQLRPRVVMVAVQRDLSARFSWPTELVVPPTVGATLQDLLAARGWRGVEAWAMGAARIAPTVVGGSKKHGGPDLGPTRARKAWADLGVDGLGIAAQAPDPDFVGHPRLTVRMVARVQGFPDAWQFWGGKTAAYRQVGNAFPPPVAGAVARRIHLALGATTTTFALSSTA